MTEMSIERCMTLWLQQTNQGPFTHHPCDKETDMTSRGVLWTTETVILGLGSLVEVGRGPRGGIRRTLLVVLMVVRIVTGVMQQAKNRLEYSVGIPCGYGGWWWYRGERYSWIRRQ